MSRHTDTRTYTATLSGMRSTRNDKTGVKFSRDSLLPPNNNSSDASVLHILLTSTKNNKYYDGKYTQATLHSVVQAADPQDEIILAEATQLYEENERDEVPAENMQGYLKQISDEWFERNRNALLLASVATDDLSAPQGDASSARVQFNATLSKNRPSISIRTWSEFKALGVKSNGEANDYFERTLYDLIGKLLNVSTALTGAVVADKFSNKETKLTENSLKLATSVLAELAVTDIKSDLLKIFTNEDNLKQFLSVYFSEAIQWARKKYHADTAGEESDSADSTKMERATVEVLLTNNDALEVILKKFKSSVRFLVREYVGMSEIIFHIQEKKSYDAVHIVYPSIINPCLVVAWNLLFDPDKSNPIFWSEPRYKSHSPAASPSKTSPEQVRSEERAKQTNISSGGSDTQHFTAQDKRIAAVTALSMLAQSGIYVDPEWIVALLLHSPHKERREVQPDIGKQNFFTAFSESGHAQQHSLMLGNTNGSHE